MRLHPSLNATLLRLRFIRRLNVEFKSHCASAFCCGSHKFDSSLWDRAKFLKDFANCSKGYFSTLCFFGSSQCTLVKLIRKRKQRIRKQRAILHVLKRTWKVILQVSLFSILLLSKPSQDLVRAPRSCLLNNPALLVRS